MPTAATATRERLLDAAWEAARSTGIDRLTLAEVGARAGVSRQAVYLHFHNRSTLLVEMARRFDRASGFRSRLVHARTLPPADGFVRVLTEWFDYVPAILPIALALEAAAMTGGIGADAYRDRMADWRDGLRIDVARLADAGLLRPGWTVDAAADWTWAQVHPTSYHHLVGERGWSPADVAERTIASLRRELVAT